MTIKEFKVGQTVFVMGDGRNQHNRFSTATAEVVKVGRKYVTISGNWGLQFKETSERRQYLIEHTEYGAPRMLFPSQGAVDEYSEREELKEWVRSAAGWEKIDRYTIEQLRFVKRILQGKDDIVTVITAAAERNAAVADLESACASLPICAACQYCKKRPCSAEVSDECDDGLSQFEWRGAGTGGMIT